MISDRFESYYNKLIIHTKERKLCWRPIQEYINAYVSNKCAESALSEHIQMIYCTEWFELFADKSFFVIKDRHILMLLHYIAESPKGGSKEEKIELLGSFDGDIRFHVYPEYLDGGFKRLQDVILEYWDSKKLDYNHDVSEKFELLEAFISSN